MDKPGQNTVLLHEETNQDIVLPSGEITQNTIPLHGEAGQTTKLRNGEVTKTLYSFMESPDKPLLLFCPRQPGEFKDRPTYATTPSQRDNVGSCPVAMDESCRTHA